jgi:hypothetical protein
MKRVGALARWNAKTRHRRVPTETSRSRALHAGAEGPDNPAEAAAQPPSEEKGALK